MQGSAAGETSITTVTGTTGADSLFGSADNDLLSGLDGHDSLHGSPGNDTLDGGAGSDAAVYTFETLPIHADLWLGLVTIGSKTDTLVSIEALYGGKGDDTLVGSTYFQGVLDGGRGNDHLISQGGDTLLGSSGNDRLESTDPPWLRNTLADYRQLDGPLRIDLDAGLVTGEHKRDVLVNIAAVAGSQGDDEMLAASDPVMIGSASVYIGFHFQGAGGNDTLRGARGADRLSGGDGNDLLLGSGGIDNLQGGPGDDTLDGGDERDMVDFYQANGPIQVDLATGRASGEGNDVLRNIENLRGGSFNDLLRGDDGNNVLDGGPGDDTVDGGDGDDTLDSAPGHDLLRGGNGNDLFALAYPDAMTLDGGAGTDTVALLSGDFQDVTVFDLAHGRWTQVGRDTTFTLTSVENALYGGKGSATIYGDDGDNYLNADTVIGRAGNDTLEGTVADYSAESAARTLSRDGSTWLARTTDEVDTLRVQQLVLGSGDDQMLGAWAAADALRTVFGGAGNDRLLGSELHGGPGDDTLVGAVASYADSAGPIFVSLARMTADGVDGNDRLVGIERVEGSSFADTLIGGAADDFLDGGPGNDLIEGGGGNDTLVGRQGADLLRGGDGADHISGHGDDTVDGGAGDDIVNLGNDLGNGQMQVDGGIGMDLLVVFWHVGGVREVNLRAGTYQSPVIDGQTFSGSVRGIEAVRSKYDFPVKLTGLDGPASTRGETFISGQGSDTIDGGSGIDMFVLSRNGRDYVIDIAASTGLPERVRFSTSVRDSLAATSGSAVANAADDLLGVERLRFNDSVLAFGDRAIDVAKVAFALWNKAIAPSTTLFGKGIDWYDDGHSYRELIDFALTYYTQLSDAQFARNLVANVPGSRSVSDVLALMAGHGGTHEGRAFVTQLYADDAANMAAIELAGFKTNGIACSLMFDDEALFTIPGS